MDRVLCCADFELDYPNNLLLDRDIQALFAGVPAGCMITCIMDCSYGETVLKLPQYYDARNRTFCRVPRATKTALWPGDKFNRGMGSEYMVRGIRPNPKVARSRPDLHLQQGNGLQDLFPGVAAFMICACRQGQVCFESTGVETRPQGVFSSCLAAALQDSFYRSERQTVADQLIKGSNSLSGPPQGPLTYFDLAKRVEERMQSYLRDNGLSEKGLEQNVLLGFTMDPKDIYFLTPPQQAYLPRPLTANAPTDGAERAKAFAGILLGESDLRKWPYVLIQLCRLGKAMEQTVQQSGYPTGSDESTQRVGLRSQASAFLIQCDVIGEFFLPPLHHIFAEADDPNDPGPPTAPGVDTGALYEGGHLRSRKHHLQLELHDPAMGTAEQMYTYAANAPNSMMERSGNGFGAGQLQRNPSYEALDRNLTQMNATVEAEPVPFSHNVAKETSFTGKPKKQGGVANSVEGRGKGEPVSLQELPVLLAQAFGDTWTAVNRADVRRVGIVTP